MGASTIYALDRADYAVFGKVMADTHLPSDIAFQWDLACWRRRTHSGSRVGSRLLQAPRAYISG